MILLLPPFQYSYAFSFVLDISKCLYFIVRSFYKLFVSGVFSVNKIVSYLPYTNSFVMISTFPS